MHPSAWIGGGGDKGLTEAEHEMGILKSQFPEGEVAEPEHRRRLGKPRQVLLFDRSIG